MMRVPPAPRLTREVAVVSRQHGTVPSRNELSRHDGTRAARRGAGASRRAALIVTASAIAALVATSTTVQSGATSTVSAYHLQAGVRLVTTQIPDVPLAIRKLVVTPGPTTVPDIAPAASTFPLYTLTSKMSASAGAVVGINGDFGTPARQPKHDLMIDGELWTSGEKPGNAVAWSEDGTSVYVGKPELRIRVATTHGAPLFSVADWNARPPTSTSVSAYTARGGSVTRPPGVTNPAADDPVWCEAALTPVGDPRWTGSQTAIARRYSVVTTEDPCRQTPLPVASDPGSLVVATRYTPGTPNLLQGLVVGDTIRLTTRYAGWPGVTDVMGGQQMLIKDGQNIAPAWYSGAHSILKRPASHRDRGDPGVLRHRSPHGLPIDPRDRRWASSDVVHRRSAASARADLASVGSMGRDESGWRWVDHDVERQVLNVLLPIVPVGRRVSRAATVGVHR